MILQFVWRTKRPFWKIKPNQKTKLCVNIKVYIVFLFFWCSIFYFSHTTPTTRIPLAQFKVFQFLPLTGLFETGFQFLASFINGFFNENEKHAWKFVEEKTLITFTWLIDLDRRVLMEWRLPKNHFRNECHIPKITQQKYRPPGSMQGLPRRKKIAGSLRRGIR